MSDQVTRIQRLLQLERAGGLSMGNGLGGGIQITHTIGEDGEGAYASFVVLSICDGDGRNAEFVFHPDYAKVEPSIIDAIQYHCNEASRITQERQGLNKPLDSQTKTLLLLRRQASSVRHPGDPS